MATVVALIVGCVCLTRIFFVRSIEHKTMSESKGKSWTCMEWFMVKNPVNYKRFFATGILLILFGLLAALLSVTIWQLTRDATRTVQEQSFTDHLIRVLYALILLVELSAHIFDYKQFHSGTADGGSFWSYQSVMKWYSRPSVMTAFAFILLFIYVFLEPIEWFYDSATSIASHRGTYGAILIAWPLTVAMNTIFDMMHDSQPAVSGLFRSLGIHEWMFAGFWVVWIANGYQNAGVGVGLIPQDLAVQVISCVAYTLVAFLLLVALFDMMFGWCGQAVAFRSMWSLLRLPAILSLLAMPWSTFIVSYQNRLWMVLALTSALLAVTIIRLFMAWLGKRRDVKSLTYMKRGNYTQVTSSSVTGTTEMRVAPRSV